MATLSPSNVTAKTTELYALSDAELILQADAVAANYLGWMKDNFDLTPEQIAYISDAPAKVQKTWGHLFAASLLTRGDISFGPLPANPAPRRTKELRMNMFGDLTYNDSSKVLNGSIEVSISSKLLS